MKFKVGDRVYGCNIDSKKMPSHVIVEQDFLFHLSPNFSFCEGATICAEYLTAIICLIQTAQIKSDDVVLIHNASEGVGLSAIEICRDVGCKIIATASCTRQQNYLRLKGIHHVFSLKDTEFATNIMNATNGKGVDVVLNFLNGEYLKNASLKICVKGASFVEISNIHLWKPEQVQQQGTDVKYFEVDLDNIFAKCDVKNKGLFDSLKALISRKVVKPNPYTRFDAINLEEALNYLEKGEYIGNVVCVMPEWKFENGNVKVHTPLFNDCITYLITGGLGSLGFTFCKWMLEEGAKYIVLASRNPPNQQQRKEINELNLDGKHVVAVKLDVGNLSQCKALVQTQIEEMGFPPLRGVMHTALALENGPITNQNWERWGPSLDSKIYGPLNLHEATKTLNLEHFVVFSSIASQFGIPFCCNYVAGNYFSDSLAHFRHSLGLPGTTVNWSQWGEVGVSCHMDVPGFKVLSTLQALNGFDNMLRTNQVQLAVANFESFPLFNICFPLTRSYVDEKEWNASGGTDDIGTKSDVIFEQLKKSLIANNKKDRYVED
ncbi:putative inactive phenolphthiocerol synthesis polyketide synthase type I Pks1 [Orchesella cincta]|uniref:Putative inactive phenolphthiocerol synthesis polyketide synthase type I Pks1 n=1 Tax=Orchesella cincta TaxID=48709 RepID=A0A1D2M498_ORCCI|nr:putative inactive phenolphthiocerol synthesis polyketide synthase type I Pks1 [Orchesella cincta]